MYLLTLFFLLDTWMQFVFLSLTSPLCEIVIQMYEMSEKLSLNY